MIGKVLENRVARLRSFWGFCIKSVAFCALFAASAVFGVTAWNIMIAGSVIFGIAMLLPFAFSALLFVGWLFYCLHRSLRQMKWRIVGFGLLLTWVCASGWFASKGNVWENLTSRYLLNSSLLLLVGILFVAAICFSMVGRTIFNRLRILCTLERHKCVFWGMSDRDLLLARSIIRSNALWQIQMNLPIEQSYDPVARARMADLADEMDAAWIFVDFTRLNKKCHSGCRHYFLGSDGHRNISLANRIVDSFCEDDRDCSEKILYVRAGDVDNEEMYSFWAQSVYEKTGHLIRAVIIKESEMIARQFMELYPPSSLPKEVLLINNDATVDVKKECGTLLLGFDHTGRSVLNATLCASRFISKSDGKTPVATPIKIVDMLEERWERFACAEPEIDAHKSEYGIEFVKHKVGSKEFEEWLKKHHQKFCRYVFCLPEDAFNIREALRVRDLLIEWNSAGAEVELLVRVEDPDMSKLESIRGGVPSLKFFGNLETLYSVDFIERDPVERIASVLNWQWTVNRNDYLDENETAKLHRDAKSARQLKEQADDVARLWEKASYYNRQASRASALGGLSFLKLLGIEWRIRQMTGSETSVPEGCRKVNVEDLCRRVSGVKDVLARTEHLRWMTYLFTLGIRTWDLKTPVSLEAIVQALPNGKFTVPNSLAKQVDRFRAHAALIPFDDLAELDVRLAHTVNPIACKNLTAKDFIGMRQPDIGGGRHPSSLQGKDYDMWAILPDAMEMAGIEFFELVTGSDADALVGDEVVPVGLHTLWSQVKDIWRWMSRSSNDERTVEQRKNELCEHLANRRNVEQVRLCARLSSDVYKDDAKLMGAIRAVPFKGFLGSSIVDSTSRKEVGDANTAFMFDDAISPHFRWCRSSSYAKTRFPYFFNAKNGMILPLYRLPVEERVKYRKSLGIVSRRVRFQRNFYDRILLRRQPDFAAQVFSFEDADEPNQTKKMKIAIVFRGTATATDWWEDIIQCFGLTPPQFRLAADLVRAVCETTDKDIVLAGHSEGGGEVQYALVKNSRRCWTGRRTISGVTINAQRLSPRLLNELKLEVDDTYAHDNITHYRTGPDIVSGWKALGIDLIGTVYTLSKKGMCYGIKSHLISEFQRVLEQKLADLDKRKSRKCEE